MMSSAKRLMIELASFAPVYPGGTRGPGRVINGLSQEKREILKQLTSDDLKDVRIDGLI